MKARQSSQDAAIAGAVSGKQIRTNEPLCRVCKAELILLMTMTPGDWSHSVWACAEHPDVTYYEFHK